MSVRLTPRPLSVVGAARELSAPALGGVAIFCGRVRPDRSRAGRVRALDYEVDRPVAERVLAQIARDVRRKYRAGRVVLWHRTGKVRVGEIAVITGAACGHRKEAFAAARELIERVKEEVPIWKEVRGPPSRPRRPRPDRRSAR